MPGDTLPPPPVSARRPHTWQRPTGPVTDEWAWLADRDDPAVIAHLEAENAWAEQWFGTRGSLIEDLFGEIKSRVKEDDDAVPVRRGAWWYTSRTVTGLAYQVHTRGTSRGTATENVILDENAEAAGHGYFSLNIFDVSNDDATLAWSGDTDGSELYTVRFRDIATGTDAPEEIPGTTWGGSAWSTDGSVFFYVVPDAAMRPWRVMRHRMGTPHTTDEVVFEEPDERFFVSVELTKSRRWIVLESSSRTSSESYLSTRTTHSLRRARCGRAGTTSSTRSTTGATGSWWSTTRGHSTSASTPPPRTRPATGTRSSATWRAPGSRRSSASPAGPRCSAGWPDSR
jgi:oligopeptidase B